MSGNRSAPYPPPPASCRPKQGLNRILLRALPFPLRRRPAGCERVASLPPAAFAPVKPQPVLLLTETAVCQCSRAPPHPPARSPPRAPAAPTHPGARTGRLGSLRWPHRSLPPALASGRPQVEEDRPQADASRLRSSLSTRRRHVRHFARYADGGAGALSRAWIAAAIANGTLGVHLFNSYLGLKGQGSSAKAAQLGAIMHPPAHPG